MTKERPYKNTLAREAALVDAQCLLQRALNENYGNPRDHEAISPARTEILFRQQRILLADKLGWSVNRVDALFADDSEMRTSDFAEALCVLGYEIKFDLIKKEN